MSEQEQPRRLAGADAGMCGAVGFLLPFYLEELQRYDTLRAGLLLTPLALTLAVVAPVSGALVDRVGSRGLAPLGLAIACAGLLLLSRLTQASSILYLILCLIVTEIGQGLFQAPNARAIMGDAPPEELVPSADAPLRIIA